MSGGEVSGKLEVYPLVELLGIEGGDGIASPMAGHIGMYIEILRDIHWGSINLVYNMELR